MAEEINPYAAPREANRTVVPQGDPTEYRPAAPKVFGILSIVFAAFGIATTIIGMIGFWLIREYLPDMPDDVREEVAKSLEQQSTGLIYAQWGFDFACSVVLLVAGIGLVMYRHWGKATFLGYAAMTILWGVVYLILFFSLQGGVDFTSAESISQLVSGIIAVCVRAIFPGLGVYFLTRHNLSGWWK